MDRKKFGLKLKKYRKLRKLTQEQFAELIDIDIRQVARIEAGGSFPSLETLIKITKILNITPNELLQISDINSKDSLIKSDIYDILALAKPEQLELIKKLIIAVL